MWRVTQRADRAAARGRRAHRSPPDGLLPRFREGASGRRRPALAGTRLNVWQVVETFRGEGGDVAATAEHLTVSARLVQAAVDFYADFSEEVDAQRADDMAFADAEHRRWERAQQVVG